MTLGEIIKIHRKQNHLSMDDFAKNCGISKPYVSILEKNQHPDSGKPINPSMKTISKIAHGMNMNSLEVFALMDSSDSDALLNPDKAVFAIPEYTKEELDEIKRYALYLKASRN